MQHLWRHLPWWIGDISQCREEARVTRLVPGFIITMILPPCHPRHEELQDYLPNLSILVQASDQAWDQLNTVRRVTNRAAISSLFSLCITKCGSQGQPYIWLSDWAVSALSDWWVTTERNLTNIWRWDQHQPRPVTLQLSQSQASMAGLLTNGGREGSDS